MNWCPQKKPQYSENFIKPQRKFAPFEPESLNFLHILPLTPGDFQSIFFKPMVSLRALLGLS